MSAWSDDLLEWLKPFVARLGHKARRRMCPLYVAGLIGPGERKSVGPMAERLAPGDYDQPHHFVPLSHRHPPTDARTAASASGDLLIQNCQGSASLVTRRATGFGAR